jgi:hypothetical protein
MTEAEWLGCTDLEDLLEQVKGKESRRNVPCTTSERKLRLFACACCRRIWHLLTDQPSRNAVLVGERFADGRATAGERAAAQRSAGNAISDISDAHWNGDWDSLDVPFIPAASAAFLLVVEGDTQWDEYTPYLPDAGEVALNCTTAVGFAGEPSAVHAEAAAERALFHEVMGNPFRPVTVHRSALPEEVILFGRTIYIERLFDRMPELADVLERAGCTDKGILDHCRGPGPHVRGCWVIDLLLGRS